MPARPDRIIALLFVCASAVAQSRSDSDLPRFDGKAVTITEPETDADGFFPKGPASVCLGGQQKQCYTAPKDFGRNPKVTVVQLEKTCPPCFSPRQAAVLAASRFILHSCGLAGA